METAFTGADILLPGPKVDMEKWAVVACDQFTSEPAYWEETRKIVGQNPSTLNLILPEVYLEAKDVEERLQVIGNHMKEYLKQGIFVEYKDAMVYVERKDSRGRKRAGLVGKIDLEEYDFRRESQSQVRATEATVTERIPPRLRVRREALLELPHIMLLLDDPKASVVEPLEKKVDSMKKLYDFSLMQEGGFVTGYLLGKEERVQVEEALRRLQEKAILLQQKEVPEKDITAKNCLLYAMGDGNHSLATAKTAYEQWKTEYPGEDTSQYPGRYALVELVNLHSSALKFKAIHRLLTEVDVKNLIEEMTEELGLLEPDQWQMQREKEENKAQIIELWYGEKVEKRVITKPRAKLAVGSVQNFLDEYLKKYPGKMDYIHGEQSLRQLAKQEHALGIHLEDMKKEELFPTVRQDGALPRKTFSMGHARDKRYYLECRKIR